MGISWRLWYSHAQMYYFNWSLRSLSFIFQIWTENCVSLSCPYSNLDYFRLTNLCFSTVLTTVIRWSISHWWHETQRIQLSLRRVFDNCIGCSLVLKCSNVIMEMMYIFIYECEFTYSHVNTYQDCVGTLYTITRMNEKVSGFKSSKILHLSLKMNPSDSELWNIPQSDNRL